MTETTATPAIIQAIDRPMARDTVPTTAPATVPRDQNPWKLLMTERPYRCCTRRPWAFMAPSITASSAPSHSSAAPRIQPSGARPMSGSAGTISR